MTDMSAPATILCFDYGLSWIGTAYGQTVTGTASPLKVLRARDGIPDWEEIRRLLDEWKPDALLVGLPLNMDDSESELSRRARKFGNRLHGRFGLPVHLADERLSSFEARGELLQQDHRNTRFRERDVDAVAARLILQSWMEQQSL